MLIRVKEVQPDGSWQERHIQYESILYTREVSPWQTDLYLNDGHHTRMTVCEDPGYLNYEFYSEKKRIDGELNRYYGPIPNETSVD